MRIDVFKDAWHSSITKNINTALFDAFYEDL